MSRTRRVLVNGPQQDDRGPWSWTLTCPLCHSEVGQFRGGVDAVTVHLVLIEVVRVERAEREGVPFYGLREGALLRGRDLLRRFKPRRSGYLKVRADDPITGDTRPIAGGEHPVRR